MSFFGFYALSGAWLFALLAPLVAFYFLKLKRPKLEIPSLVLWRQALTDQRVNSPFQRFKRNTSCSSRSLSWRWSCWRRCSRSGEASPPACGACPS